MYKSADFFKHLKNELSQGRTVYVTTDLATGEKTAGSNAAEGFFDNAYHEKINPLQRLVLCGAGHVSAALCPLAAQAGFFVCVIDDRAELLTKSRFSLAGELKALPFEKALLNEGGADNYFAVLTRGHLQDRLCLEHILKKQFAYCGMIGSRKKNEAVFEQLYKSGFTKDDTAKVCAPIGLSIGAETPFEIAVSITAQLIEKRKAHNVSEGFDARVLNALCSEQACALATVCEKSGSAPRGIGSRMALLKSGEIEGSVGGGAAEAEVINKLLALPGNAAPQLLEIEMNNRSAAEQGLICGGKVKILLEKI